MTVNPQLLLWRTFDAKSLFRFGLAWDFLEKQMKPWSPFNCLLCILHRFKFMPHLAVAMSSVIVMMPMHGENLLKKQTTHKFFYCKESKTLSMHWRHHGTNSCQRSSGLLIACWVFLSNSNLMNMKVHMRFYCMKITGNYRNKLNIKNPIIRMFCICNLFMKCKSIWPWYAFESLMRTSLCSKYHI